MSIPFFTSILLSYILILLAMAFYTLLERKFLGYFQTRKGPNKPGILGLPQPFADAIKLFVKEQTKPTTSNHTPFMLAPVLSLTLALLLWAIYPHTNQSFFFIFGVMYFLCVSSMNVYATFMAGWCSNSKYALLGALRGIAQTISYEVSMSLILMCALITLSSLDMTLISTFQYSWIMFLIMPIALMWFISCLAETNRTPFDFAEGESELVSGFNVEYSSGLFALIFMAEYTSILAMSMLTVVFFTSSTLLPPHNMFLVLKTLFLSMVFIWIRATLPRMRYDHLMFLTWKSFLPMALATLILLTPLIFLTT